MLVANLILVNAGGLLVFPAYIGKTDEISAIVKLAIANSASFFVAGLLSGFFAGYIAYLNYQFHMQHRLAGLYLEEHDLDSNPGIDTTGQDLDRRKNLVSKEKTWTRRILLTFWAGQAFGWISILSFVAACYFARQAMLGI